MAAAESAREVRKRRERRDSGSAHERKERRAPSEERAPPPPPPPPPPPLHDHNRIESERRAERLYRARRPAHKKRAPRPRPERRRGDEGRPSSPYVDCGLRGPASPPDPEPPPPPPQPAEEPQRSPAAETARPHDARPPPRARDLAPDRRLDRMTKKINILKKDIAAYEAELATTLGHPLTPAECLTDVRLARLHEALRRLKEERKCLRLDPAEYALKLQAARAQRERDERLEAALASDRSMAEVVQDIEEWLEGWRKADGRDINDERAWSSAQLAAEKRCVQRALLRLEAARGRPQAHSAERGAARHLYDRYRNVKRNLTALTSDALLGSVSSELCTIHEHELLSTGADSAAEPRPDHREEQESQPPQETAETPLSPAAGEEGSASSAQSASDEAAPTNEALHCLSLDDLARALAEAKVQKLILRQTIKECESRFDLKAGRRVSRDVTEEEMQRYRAVKARIKLLNALINKQK